MKSFSPILLLSIALASLSHGFVLPSQHYPTATSSSTLLRDTSTSASSAVTFVEDVLGSLRSSASSEEAGVAASRLLLQSSTDDWRTKIYQALGAPETADDSTVAQSLHRALQRQDKQWGLLVTSDYAMEFPSDPVDYQDGDSCWVECRLSRNDASDDLLVAMGCTLVPSSSSSNGWLIQSIEWQDFRDQFSPGLGRDEWMPLF